MLYEKIEFEPDETVLITVRKHWFVILSELLGVFLTLLSPFFIVFLLAFLPDLLPSSLHLGTYLPIFAFAMTVWIIFSLLTAFMIWTQYYLDLWVVTDHRIIAVDQVHFFNRKVSSFRLERLQDMKVTVNGIIPTFLNFGDIHAHTAGTGEENFSTTGLPDPRNLQAIIQKATDARLKSINQGVTGL
ncbi:MAG: PH domain-containing protein [Candidatus Paceibacterota bacterium]